MVVPSRALMRALSSSRAFHYSLARFDESPAGETECVFSLPFPEGLHSITGQLLRPFATPKNI